MFYGGPKEAIMHAIYRQNFGFTDIVIGRKHADAPYDDGKDIWDGLAAQRKFDELKGELLIQPVKVGFAAFYEELGRVGLVDEYALQGLQAGVDQRPRSAREAARRRAARPAHHASGDGPDPDRKHARQVNGFHQQIAGFVAEFARIQFHRVCLRKTEFLRIQLRRLANHVVHVSGVGRGLILGPLKNTIMSMIICLFDIDGTLLSSGGAGKAALEAALTQDFAIPIRAQVPYSGRTDRAIIRELFPRP